MKEGRPRWPLDEHEDGTITLHLSVWRKEGCRSHFFLRHGKIVLVPRDRPGVTLRISAHHRSSITDRARRLSAQDLVPTAPTGGPPWG